MEYTNSEKRLIVLLTVYSILFLAVSIVSAYYFIFHHRETSLLHLSTPFLFLLFFIFSFLGSKGVRENNIFIDLLNLSFLTIIIITAVKYFTSDDMLFKDIFGEYALLFAVLSIITVFAWRKAVISRFGLKELSPTEALSYRALAEVVIGDFKVEGYSFDTIVKDFDNYLNRFQSAQKFSAELVYLIIQYFPLIFLNVPLTWMGIEDREKFIKKRFYCR